MPGVSFGSERGNAETHPSLSVSSVSPHFVFPPLSRQLRPLHSSRKHFYSGMQQRPSQGLFRNAYAIWYQAEGGFRLDARAVGCDCQVAG